MPTIDGNRYLTTRKKADRCSYFRIGTIKAYLTGKIMLASWLVLSKPLNAKFASSNPLKNC